MKNVFSMMEYKQTLLAGEIPECSQALEMKHVPKQPTVRKLKENFFQYLQNIETEASGGGTCL